MTRVSTFRLAIVAIIIAAITTFPGTAQSGGGGRLAGTWETVVTIRNCMTGDVITTFQSTSGFNQGGTYSGITSGSAPTARSAEQGVWSHVKANTYRFRFKAYLFNPAGVATAYQVVTHELSLNGDASSWSSGGIAEIFSMTGTPIGNGCSTAEATRMVID